MNHQYENKKLEASLLDFLCINIINKKLKCFFWFRKSSLFKSLPIFKKMSYNRKQTVAKKFCKVCQDAGKSESEYTSHFVRDSPGPNGKVICPTLLSQNCRGCGINGHTYKYCPTIKQNMREERKEQRWKQAEEKLVQKVQPKQVKEIVVKSGKYASILMSSSSDEEDDAPAKKIAHKKARILDEDEKEEVKIVPANTYASRLIAPAPPKKVENPKVKVLEEVEVVPVVEKRTCTKEEKEEIKNFIKKVMTAKCAWDESSDDESDDDEEEEEEKPVIPQAPKVLKPIVLKSEKKVVEKIKEEDMPIIRREPLSHVKKVVVPAPAPKKQVPEKKEMIQIVLKDAWSDDES